MFQYAVKRSTISEKENMFADSRLHFLGGSRRFCKNILVLLTKFCWNISWIGESCNNKNFFRYPAKDHEFSTEKKS